MKAAIFVVACAVSASAQTTFPPQPYNLLPQKTDGGILFQCFAPEAKVVYLAGDFNGWASNEGGRITKPEFAMTGPGTNGVWRKVVKLDPGSYKFKFNINGETDGWFAPDSIDELDGDKNAILRVTGSGDVALRSARNPDWKPQRTDRGVRFQFYAPDAFIVYLAGDFNDWAKNRDGLACDPKFAMQGPDSNGVWQATVPLLPGRHIYQFVIDGDRWITDPNAEENNNENHSVLVVK